MRDQTVVKFHTDSTLENRCDAFYDWVTILVTTQIQVTASKENRKRTSNLPASQVIRNWRT